MITCKWISKKNNDKCQENMIVFFFLSIKRMHHLKCYLRIPSTISQQKSYLCSQIQTSMKPHPYIQSQSWAAQDVYIRLGNKCIASPINHI